MQTTMERRITQQSMRKLLLGSVSAIGLHLILIIGSIAMLIPFLWTISSSFKQITDIFNFPPSLWPTSPTLSNYSDLFTQAPFARWYLNSVLVAAISTALAVFFSALAGFGFAKYDFPLRGVLFKILIGTLIIPFQLVLIPLFIIMSKIDWMDSYAALIVPFMAPAFGIFLTLDAECGPWHSHETFFVDVFSAADAFAVLTAIHSFQRLLNGLQALEVTFVKVV